jgi:hypothetical protein
MAMTTIAPTRVPAIRMLLFSFIAGGIAFATVLFLFCTVSVLEDFQVYPHAGASFPLFLVEVVLALLSAGIAGLICAQRLSPLSHYPERGNLRRDGKESVSEPRR